MKKILKRSGAAGTNGDPDYFNERKKNPDAWSAGTREEIERRVALRDQRIKKAS